MSLLETKAYQQVELILKRTENVCEAFFFFFFQRIAQCYRLSANITLSLFFCRL